MLVKGLQSTSVRELHPAKKLTSNRGTLPSGLRSTGERRLEQFRRKPARGVFREAANGARSMEVSPVHPSKNPQPIEDTLDSGVKSIDFMPTHPAKKHTPMAVTCERGVKST